MDMVKRAGWVLLVGGCAVVGILVAKRVQPDALALLFGAVAGFLISLPVGLLGFLLLARQMRQGRSGKREEEASPPVVIVASGAAPQVWRQPGTQPDLPGAPDAPQGRRFVVGDWD